MKNESKYWIYYPIPNVRKPLESMKKLAGKLGIKPCTLTCYKRRRMAIGALGGAYIIDFKFAQEEIDRLHDKAIQKIEPHEQWKSITDGEYFISNYGRIKNKRDKILSQHIRGGGLCVTLRLKRSHNKPVSYFVSRLVAEVFLLKKRMCDKIDTMKKQFVIHLNSCKFDNRDTNLIFSNKESIGELGFINGLNRPVIQLDMNGAEIDYFDSINEAHKMTHINAQNISLCTLGKRATAGGYKWMLDSVGGIS